MKIIIMIGQGLVQSVKSDDITIEVEVLNLDYNKDKDLEIEYNSLPFNIY